MAKVNELTKNLNSLAEFYADRPIVSYAIQKAIDNLDESDTNSIERAETIINCLIVCQVYNKSEALYKSQIVDKVCAETGCENLDVEGFVEDFYESEKQKWTKEQLAEIFTGYYPEAD